ncbi:exported protein of unknown function [Nitrospira defluvii]|uniref:Uncharacterized protein n=1 Tax=Nitrospira defluvii TaxID=330214 RepID=D8PCX6_9BACT|nr:exported protein of unknown function [Nitrospira defluvii]
MRQSASQAATGLTGMWVALAGGGWARKGLVEATSERCCEGPSSQLTVQSREGIRG